MTVARTIAITAAVCAAIGMTTKAEATTFTGCAYWVPLCGFVMTDIAGNRYTFVPPERVPPYVPLEVVGRKSGDIYIGWCKATRVNVISVRSAGQSCGVNLR